VYGLNEDGLGGVIEEGASSQRNHPVEGRWGHVAVSPDGVQQLLTPQQLTWPGHQLCQDGEYLRLQDDFLALAAEAAIGGVELAVTAAENSLVQTCALRSSGLSLQGRRSLGLTNPSRTRDPPRIFQA
jgi:hypothetical protein